MVHFLWRSNSINLDFSLFQFLILFKIYTWVLVSFVSLYKFLDLLRHTWVVFVNLFKSKQWCFRGLCEKSLHLKNSLILFLDRLNTWLSDWLRHDWEILQVMNTYCGQKIKITLLNEYKNSKIVQWTFVLHHVSYQLLICSDLRAINVLYFCEL